MKSISISEARNKLLSLPEELKKDIEDGALAITRRGAPVLAIMDYELYSSIIETLEVLSDSELMSALRQSIDEANQGKND